MTGQPPAGSSSSPSSPARTSARGRRVAEERRRLVVLALLLGVLLVFVLRLVWVQGIQGASLAAEAQAARTASREVIAPRGQILDSSGEVLAASVERYDVGARPDAVAQFVHRDEGGDEVGRGAVEAARLLAPLLGSTEAEVGGLLVGDGFTYLARSVTPDVRRQIAALRIPGIEMDRTSARYYPNGPTAGNVVGFINAEGTGQAGIELTYDEELTGVNGEVSYERGSGGQVIPGGRRTETPAVPGADVRLSIDRDLQYRAQVAADEAKERRGAQWSAVVVEEIGTGRILALADSGAVDPNAVGETPAEDRGARSVSAPFEPGSTGKLPTFAASLDQGEVSPMSIFTVPDRVEMPNGQAFSDNDEHPTWRLYMSGVVANSLNTGTVQIGDLIDDDVRYDYLTGFGLGSRTGVELPGESSGQLGAPATWDGRQRYTTMFGQGYSATLLQLNSMVATIGNSGVRVQPHIVDAVTRADGTTQETEIDEGTQVISAEASRDLIAMMEGVTGEGGTGILGRVPGYRVAAKTGTAQIADAAGGLTGRLGTFTGLIPAEAPRIAVSVVVYQPSGVPYGGVVAAPVFADVAGFAMAHLNVPPSQEPAPNLPWSPDWPNPGDEDESTIQSRQEAEAEAVEAADDPTDTSTGTGAAPDGAQDPAGPDEPDDPDDPDEPVGDDAGAADGAPDAGATEGAG